MPPRPLALGLALLATTTACKKDSPPAASEQASPKSERQQQCERFATEMAQTVGLTGQLLITALEDSPSEAQQGREEMGAEARKLRQELLDKCMKWPDDVMECLPPLGVLKDGCEAKLIAALDGATPRPESVPAGPPSAWSYALDSEPRAMAVADDGTVVVVAGVEGNSLLGLRDGAIAWRREGQHRRWIDTDAPTPSTWIAAEDGQAIAFDPKTGAVRWIATLPPNGGGSTTAIETVAWSGEALLAGDADARFFRIEPARCTTAETSPPGCVTMGFELDGEILDDRACLLVDDGGQRYLWEEGQLRALGPDGATLMDVKAHEALDFVGVHGSQLRLLVDDEVVALDGSQCRGEAAIAPSQWPHADTLTFAGSDLCPECTAPAEGCRPWRAHVREASGSRPAVLGDGTVVLHDDSGHTLLVSDGTVRWKATTGGFGPLVTDGTRVFGLQTSDEDDEEAEVSVSVFELDAKDGAPRWATVLPSAGEASVMDDEVDLAVRGRWLAVSYQQRVHLLSLPPA